MTTDDVHRPVGSPLIPRPRTPEDERIGRQETPRRDHGGEAPPLPPAHFPWPEPWRYSPGARVRSEFWDAATASWHSAGPYPRRSR